MITIADFKDILISKSGGKPLGKVANFYSLCYQAMIKTKFNVDLPSSMRTVQLTNPVYTNIFMYPLPSDISLNGLVNLRPLTPDDTYYDYKNINQRQVGIETKYNTATQSGSSVSKRYGIRNINGVQYLLVNDNTTSPIVIQSCESLTASGSVAVVGVSTALAEDALQKISGGSSFSFTANAGATNGIGGTLSTAVDLSGQNDIIGYVYIPSLSNLTGIKIKLGQSAAAYYESTIATDFFGNALALGWNLIRLPKSTFSVGAGVPTWTSVVYWTMELVGTLVGSTTGWRFDSLVGNLGALREIDYYADYQFQTLAGAWISKPTADTDKIIISGDEIDLYTDQFIELMTVDLKQQGVAVDFQTYGGTKLNDDYLEFKFKHPSQRQLMTTQYGSSPQSRINN